MLEIEERFQVRGYRLIAGMDEAGRGPLAGPVSCAAVIMPLDDLIPGIDDSKKLSEKKREMLYDRIIEKAIAYKITFIDHHTIDEINILNATKQGMNMCIRLLPVQPDFVLVDAVQGLKLDMPCLPVIHGDALSYSIACASILAKVARDRLMCAMDEQFPEYNFKQHKGYGTREHIENLKKFGKCDIHRESFIKKFVEG